MRVDLLITIFPGGLPLDLAELVATLPGLSLGIGEHVERADIHFAGRLVIDDESDASRQEVAGHLAALRQFSRDTPGTTITIAAIPDGGVLTLRDGSFGDDEEALIELLGEVASTSKLYISFRIEQDAHAHLRDLIERATPGHVAVCESSETSLAVGFDVKGGPANLAMLIAELRLAWRHEGSECECLIEIEGGHPVTRVLRGWSDWIELERSLRRAEATTTQPAGAPMSIRLAKLADAPGVSRVLGNAMLTWIDAEDQLLCLADDALCAVTERIEVGTAWWGEIRRRAGDSLAYVCKDKVVELPPVDHDVDRRLHTAHARGVLFTETRGGFEAARTQLVLVNAAGIEHGPVFEQVSAIDAVGGEALVLARRGMQLALFAVELGRGWGYSEHCPWHSTDTPTDVALISTSRAAIAAVRGARSVLYMVERANLRHARELALPCVDPQIVAHGHHTIWLTGLSPPPSPRRCDLFRVDLLLGAVSCVSAELPDSPSIDVVTDAGNEQLLFATSRAVYATKVEPRAAPVATLELAGGDEITGMVIGKTTGVFLRGPRGCRLVLGRDTTVPLQLPGFEPKL